MKPKKKTCSQKKVSKVMHEWKTKKLKLRNGKVVKNHKQAIAIALSEARRYCDKKSKKSKGKGGLSRSIKRKRSRSNKSKRSKH